MRRNTTTWGMIAASGALVLTLAACGEDSPEVEEPNAGAEAGTEETAGTDEGTDEGAETEDTGAETEDTGTETEDAGSETEDTGTETEDAGEGGAGGDAAAGEEIEPAAFVEQLKSPGMDAMTSFTMNMDMQMKGQAVTMIGKADLSGAPAMDITMEMPGMGNIHMIMVDGNAYMGMPGVTEEGQFVQMPLEEVMGEDADEFTNQIDMTSQWDAWETGAQKITFIGPEDVDGETLNHYEMLLDTEGLEDASAAGMPAEITYDVWLDDQNFMRQVTFDIAGAETVMKMDDWGQPVDIAAPDASSIVEMPGMPTAP